jgi:hypothetical protein
LLDSSRPRIVYASAAEAAAAQEAKRAKRLELNEKRKHRWDQQQEDAKVMM